jgi:PDDEXK-like domain of unknown function (DUF3799)
MPDGMSQITKITAPGVYDLDSETYHADCCETPSLSAGMINEILVAPAKCYETSRRLNPAWEPPEKQTKFSIGSVSHVMFLEPHLFAEQVVVVRGKTKDGKPSDGYSSQDAKDQRDAALAAGKAPILPAQLDEIYKARDAFFANTFTRDAFANGKFEQSLFWRHPIYGFWCRAKPDFIAGSLAHLNDYKATANAAPSNFGRHAHNMGYHRRAAWYLEGAQAIFGKRPDHYWFCNQEVKSPYLTSVVELDWQALEAGQDENDHAAGIFARCLETGDWYGYRDSDHLEADRAFRVGLPTYAYMQIDERLGRRRPDWAVKAETEQRALLADEYEGVE